VLHREPIASVEVAEVLAALASISFVVTA